MTSISSTLISFFRFRAFVVAMVLLAMAITVPAFAATQIPDNDDQDVLIRTTLMTFNDANMTNNYAVFYAKASKEFQSQITTEKMQPGFEPFRKNELYFED